MKTLYPIQQTAHDFFLEKQRAGFSTLDTSGTGCGKTITAVRLMSSLGLPFGVVAPKATLIQWQRACEEEGLSPLFIVSYQKLNAGKTGYFTKELRDRVSKKTGKVTKTRHFAWRLPAKCILIFDEVHACVNPFTGNSIAHIKATQLGIQTHNLSATAAEDPTEMRALGFALKLHNLDTPTAKLRSWFSWMRSLGCKMDPWKKWYAGKTTRTSMLQLKQWLYANRAFRILRSDMPEAFRENSIVTEFVTVEDPDKFYRKEGFTPEVIRAYIENGVVPEDCEHFLTALTRARQFSEASKVPILVEQTRDLLREGFSVAIFTCFRDTVSALLSEIPDAGIVQGEQDAEERQAHVDAFQRGESKVIIVNIAAGGAGLSLHDETGDHPRVSLICVDWSAKKTKQVFGRTDRAGMKSNSLQKVLIAADSVEEDVWKSVTRRMENMDTLLEQ